MTREEEIQRKAGELADFGISHYQPNQQQYYEGFIDGAKWADQNPRKGLWDAMKEMKEALQTEYEKGRFDMREEMMKDAVETTIVNDWQYGKDPDHAIIPAIHHRIKGFNIGDKVKLIIVKED